MGKIKHVTRTEFRAYEKVRESGVTNMLDFEVVSKLSNLTEQKIMFIIKHYDELKELYGKKY